VFINPIIGLVNVTLIFKIENKLTKFVFPLPSH